MAVILRWFPPSWLELVNDRTRIYIDPAYLKTYYKKHPTRIEFSSWPDEIDGLPEPLEPADVVLVTHAHKDHCKLVTVKRLLRDGTDVYGPASCKSELGDLLTVVASGDVIEVAGATVEVVDAHNTPDGRSTVKQHPRGRDVGYVVTLGGQRIYHAGDTDVRPMMSDLRDLDVACLPVGGRFTMDASEAVEAAQAMLPRWVVPMHFLKSDPEIFFQQMGSIATEAQAARLGIGESLVLADGV